MNTQIETILSAEETILDLEKQISKIQKDFKENNTPKYEVGKTYIVSKIDSGILFEITQATTAYNNQEIISRTSSCLNAIFSFDIDKNSIEYEKMLLANKGLMFVYILTECGKNGKAKKIGARSHVLTEWEIDKFLKNGNLKASI